MATILDVAKLAGVSQGTASNVLNGKGNVSSEKIKLVEEAARQLGYTINERAKILRKGSGNLICIILPSIEYKKYRNFYYSLKYYVERNGYLTELLLSNDNPQTEKELIQRAQAMMAAGLVSISCIQEKQNYYQDKGFEHVIFVERKPEFACDYFGFDYEKAGEELAKQVLEKDHKKIALITGSLKYSNENDFFRGFQREMDRQEQVNHQVSSDIRRLAHTLLELLISGTRYDTIVTTSLSFAKKIEQTVEVFLTGDKIPVYTLSPVMSLPERKFHKYELNYSLLGREVASVLLEKENGTPLQSVIYENDGIKNWADIEIRNKVAKNINILTLESPEANIMKGLAKIYTEKTGIAVNVSIFSYDEIYEQFLLAETFDKYDVLRIDATWLSLFAERVFMPLEAIDPKIKNAFDAFIPSLSEKYAYVNGKLYALPITPSVQILFYRKDLFENTVNRRLYQEKYKKELKVPQTFLEFNQIAEFFTELANKGEADVKYGCTLTLENTGVVSTEFLARLFSHKKYLYENCGKIIINDEAGKLALKELLEAQKFSSARPSRWWTATAQEFANGESAMMINFSNFASEILGRKSKVVENIGFSMVPGGNPVYGGGSIGVSKNSKHKKEALAFIKWMTKEPITSATAALGSVSPCIKTYTNYDIINTFPWLELSKDCFELSTTSRVPKHCKHSFDEKRFVNIVGTAVKNVIMGFMTEEEALNHAQLLIDRELNSKVTENK